MKRRERGDGSVIPPMAAQPQGDTMTLQSLLPYPSASGCVQEQPENPAFRSASADIPDLGGMASKSV